MKNALKDKYQKYKSTDIAWFGDIPGHWTIVRLKDIAKKVKTGTTPSTAKGDFFTGGTECWFTPSDLNGAVIRSSNRMVIKKAIKEKEIEVFPVNSIFLVGIGASLGKVGISQVIAGCNQQINVIVNNPKKILPKFSFYQMVVVGSTLLGWSNYTTMPIFTQTDTKSLNLLLPPLHEQSLISDYLDLKTTLIDKRISLLEEKAKYYKELSRSLINETVCKGLNKSVPLKDSGIEWIGQIPKHWQVKRLKDVGYLYSGLSGKTGEHFNQELNDNSQHYIPFTNIANNKYINHEDLHTVLMDENEKQNKVKKGDLFFLMSSEGFADIGKSALLVEDVKDTFLNSFCKGYRIAKKSVVPKYLNYLLNSTSFRDKLIVQGKGFTRINLKMEKVNDFEFIVPPIEEQITISEYLDNKTTIIEEIVANIKKQINSLKDLRKILINDVVTGKLKVTG